MAWPSPPGRVLELPFQTQVLAFSSRWFSSLTSFQAQHGQSFLTTTPGLHTFSDNITGFKYSFRGIKPIGCFLSVAWVLPVW